MSSNTDGVNPLRPYYIPPTIGEAPEVRATTGGPSFNRGNATAGSGYASKARDMFQDLDYNYLNESQPSMVQNAKELVDELIWKYTSVLMAQPFEVAKMILQTRDQDTTASLSTPQIPDSSTKRTSSYGSSAYDVREPGSLTACASTDLKNHSFPTPIPTATSLTISPRMFPTHRRLSVLGGMGIAEASPQLSPPFRRPSQAKPATQSHT